MTPYILLIGLGVHAIFEGLALGLSNEIEEVELYSIAILLHKGAAGMSLAISLAKAFPDNRRFVLIMLTLFAVFTPLGVFLGMMVPSDNDMAELVCASLAAGTFLYIACSEVIIEEFADSTHRVAKFLFFILGVLVCWVWQ